MKTQLVKIKQDYDIFNADHFKSLIDRKCNIFIANNKF